MISFRYHVVTIVAVFLALGLGLLAGSSFGQPALVSQLRARTDAQLQRIDELRAEADALRVRAGTLDAFSAAAMPYLVDGRLEGYRAIVVTQEGVSGATERTALDALERAGADVIITLSLQPSLAGTEPADAASLRAVIGDSSPADAIAARLTTPVAPPSGTDVLLALVDGGFLATRSIGIDEAMRERIRGGGDLVFVVLGGAAAGDEPSITAAIAADLVRALATIGSPVAAGEGTDVADPWVGDLRGDGIVTVAGLDDAPGASALVLGMRDRLVTGRGGAYGTASAALP